MAAPGRRARLATYMEFSAAYDHFAKLVAGEKKFQRLKLVEQFLQASIVEDLFRLAAAALSYQ